ncbi:MAG: A24 family peptidase [Actinomycetota bacterium]
MDAVVYAAGLVVALRAAYVDARTHLLRDVYTGPLALIALVGLPLSAAIADTGVRIGAMALGVLVFAGPWLVAHLISPASAGYGDVKYSAALGLYLGWESPAVAFRALFLASAIGALVAGVALILRRRRTPLPFGPSLLAGATIALAAHWLGAVD